MHALTIQGHPWTPCPQCPRRAENGGDGSEGVCPSRRHPAYCDHAAKDWAKWRDKIRDAAIEDRPGRVVKATGADPIPDLTGWPAIDPDTFIRTGQLITDALTLIPRLASVDLIVGIARSGLIPASVLATHLHVPLMSWDRTTGLQEVGAGIRMDGYEAGPVRRVALVDDTAATGFIMQKAAPAVQDRFPDAEIVRTVVYTRAEASPHLDLFAAVYPGLHYLEWNFVNAGHGEGAGYDFDGILCEDITADDDDDGPRYQRALTDAKPLYLPRRRTIPLIVTARGEDRREVTLDWLARHGVTCHELVMRDFPRPDESEWARVVGTWKGQRYHDSGTTLFIESGPDQAAVIAEVSGKPVLCPELGRVIRPASKARPEIRQQFAALKLVKACPHRDRAGCGCNGAAFCRDRDGVKVYQQDCIECVSSRTNTETRQIP
jgi:hypothetical protein